MCVCVSFLERETHTQTHTLLTLAPPDHLRIICSFPACPGAQSPMWALAGHTLTHKMIMSGWVRAALENVSGENGTMPGKCVCVRETVFWPITVKYCSLLHVYELVWIRYCFFWYNTVILLVALFAHSMTSSDNDIVSQTSENAPSEDMKQITQGCVCVLDLNDPHNVQNNRERSCHTVAHNAMCSTASSISSVANHKKEFLKIYKYLDCWRFGHLMQIH